MYISGLGITFVINTRAATGGKAAKAWSLARFGELESGAGKVATTMAALPAKNLPWRPCIVYDCQFYSYFNSFQNFYFGKYSFQIRYFFPHSQ